jgi:hypothetical protein
VREFLAVIAILCCLPLRAEAQRQWRTEIGLQGGFTRAVLAGTGADPTDAYTLPGFDLGPALPVATGLFVIIPWSNKLAFEADFAASQLSIGTSGTFLMLGARGNYALAPGLYAAAGGAMSYSNGIFGNDTQLGVQGALGFRARLSGSLRGRLELRSTFWGKTDNFGAVDAYSVLLGLSTETSPARTSSPTVRTAASGRWSPSIGIAGGYAHVKLVGGGSLTTLAVPGYGSGLNAIFIPEVTLPPTIFAILPLGRRIALEPAIDVQRFQESGQTDFSANAAARLDYVVRGDWYGALGGNFHYVKSTGIKAFVRPGVNVAWGYRFTFGGALRARVETNYTMFAGNRTFRIEPANAFGVMLGVMSPLR